MGYYSSIEIRPKIKENRIQEIRSKLPVKEDWFQYYEDMEITDEGYIVFPEYFAKWYKTDDFVKFLNPFIEMGKIEFFGEDSTIWGYWFNGKGKVFHLKYLDPEIGNEVV